MHVSGGIAQFFFFFFFEFQPENHSDTKLMMIYLRMLVTFTRTATWKILKGKGGNNNYSVYLKYPDIVLDTVLFSLLSIFYFVKK